MICPHCGAPLENGSWFCLSCGRVLSGAAAAPSRAQYRRGTRTTSGIGAASSVSCASKVPSASRVAHTTNRTANIEDAILRASLASATPSPSMGDLLTATSPVQHLAHPSQYAAAPRRREEKLSTQLSARQAYVPEPLVGASPLLAVGAAAAALALATTLSRTGAGITGLPTLGSLVKPPSTEQVATTGISATGTITAEKDTDQGSSANAGEPAASQSAGDASQSVSQPASAPAATAPAATAPAADSSQPAPATTLAAPSTTTSDLPYTYTLVHQAMTWAEAEAYCEQQGGQLAQPHTVAEWRAVLDLSESSDAYVIWLGGTRQADGTFEWLDGSPASLRVWAQDEPNNIDGTEDRLALLRYKNGAGLYDVPGDVSQAYPASYLGFVMQQAK